MELSSWNGAAQADARVEKESVREAIEGNRGGGRKNAALAVFVEQESFQREPIKRITTQKGVEEKRRRRRGRLLSEKQPRSDGAAVNLQRDPAAPAVPSQQGEQPFRQRFSPPLSRGSNGRSSGGRRAATVTERRRGSGLERPFCSRWRRGREVEEGKELHLKCCPHHMWLSFVSAASVWAN